MFALDRPLTAQQHAPAASCAWEHPTESDLGSRLPVLSPRVKSASVDAPPRYVGRDEAGPLRVKPMNPIDRMATGMGYGGLGGALAFVLADAVAGPFWGEEPGLSGFLSGLLGAIVGAAVGGAVGLLTGL